MSARLEDNTMSRLTKKNLDALTKAYKGLSYAHASEKQKQRINFLLTYYDVYQLQELVAADIDFVSDAARAVLKTKNIEVAFAELQSKMEVEALQPSSPDTFHEAAKIAPAGVILAQVVEKNRNGDETTTYELASMVKRLAFSELSAAEIASRFSAAFQDVLIRED